MARNYSEPISLTRDTTATEIPSGVKVMLNAGARVQIAQVLGGNFTVMTDQGYLVRIADADADALGAQYAEALAQAKKDEPAPVAAVGPLLVTMIV